MKLASRRQYAPSRLLETRAPGARRRPPLASWGRQPTSSVGSEDLRAPGQPVPPKEPVGAGQRPFLQLLDAARAREGCELDAAEERRGERLHRESQVGLLLGLRRGPALELPPSLVPWTEIVHHLEHDRVLRRVTPIGERRTDVDEPNPEGIAESKPQTPRRREQEEERMVGRQKPGLDGCLPVDGEEEAPQISHGLGRAAERLEHAQLGDRRAVLPAGLVTVDGIAFDRTVVLVDDPALRPGSVAAILRILDLPVLPPQPIPGEHSGPVGADALEQRRDRLEDLVALGKA